MAASGDGATLDQNQTSGLSSMNHQNESSLYDGRAKDASAQSKDCSQLSWADLVEEEEETRRMCNRDTSRALVIHERLSSPSRTTLADLLFLTDQGFSIFFAFHANC